MEVSDLDTLLLINRSPNKEELIWILAIYPRPIKPVVDHKYLIKNWTAHCCFKIMPRY